MVPIHAASFIRNVVKIGLVLILLFCTDVSYFQWHILASRFLFKKGPLITNFDRYIMRVLQRGEAIAIFGSRGVGWFSGKGGSKGFGKH